MADTFRVKAEASESRGAVLALARDFQLPVEAARRLLSQPRVLPRDLGEAEARRLVETLRKFGVHCEAVAVVGRSSALCRAHPSLSPDQPCTDCRELVCVLCQGPGGEPLCAACAAKRRRRSRAKGVRVAVLLSLLGVIVLWGVGRQRSLSRRVGWTRTLNVAVVLLARGEVKPEVLQAWRDGAEQLEGWMTREAGRYGLGLREPVHFVLSGPVSAAGVEIRAPEDSLVSRAREAWRLSRTLAEVDTAARVEPGMDARIYVTLEPDEDGERFVEGMADAGGSVGMVRGVLGDTELTLELTAVAHELFHCLGAADAYDVNGHARVPEGLVEPKREPLYPQPAAEVMVGEVPLDVDRGRLPTSLDQVRVGPATAAALHWTR